MNKFKLYFILLFSGLVLFSCKKDDDGDYIEELRAYDTQYATEKAMIETYMRTHYIKSLNEAPGTIQDMDVVIDEIPENNPAGLTSLWYHANKDSVSVDLHGLTYKMYYIKFRVGDPSEESPSKVDKVLAAYDGYYLNSLNKMNSFEYQPFPQVSFALDNVIQGWTEIFPLFKPGTSDATPGEVTIYNNFGSGLMFIPSGLGYYNIARPKIPAYAPLMFSFKFYKMERSDTDGDGILSIHEDLNGNGIFTDDDTDGDGIPNYLDADDDGDGTSTLAELKKPVEYLNRNHPEFSGPALYYPYDPIENTQDPLKSETRGAPSCTNDYLSPTRLRKYLDPTCQ